MNEYEDVIFQKMDEFLKKYDSSFMQIKSYDFFLNHRLSKIIEEEPTIEIQLSENKFYVIYFGQVFVDKPYIIDENRQIRYITPNEARLRDLTYSSLISINIRTSFIEKRDNQIVEETNVQEFYKISLARIPMMIGTTKCNLYGKTVEQRKKLGECEYDRGGYFIIKGKERVLVSQERINYNIVHVFDTKMNSKYYMMAEIRSMSEETGHSVLLLMKLVNTIDHKIVLQIPYVSQDIPLGYIFRAFDFSLYEMIDILEFNLKSEFGNFPVIHKIYKNIVKDFQMISSSDRAISYISQFSVHSLSKERKTYYIHQILNNELFPHLGITSSKAQKGFFLGHMLSKLVFTFVKKRSFDDRDHINNKRIEASGHLVSELFRTLFKRFVRSMQPQLAKRPDILVVMNRNNIISQGIKHCFSTGNWGIPKSNYIRTGVSQIMNRLTYNSFQSHMRRILIPIGKEGKNTKIRQLHPSQIGYICPFETPEGHCLSPDCEILLSDGISTVPMDRFKSNNLKIVTFDLHTGAMEKTFVKDYFEVLPQKMLQIELASKRGIKSSGLHPFLVYEEGGLYWKKAQDLRQGDLLATTFVPQKIDDLPSNITLRLLGLIRSTFCAKEKCIVVPQELRLEKIIKEFRRVRDPNVRWEKISRKIFLDYPIDKIFFESIIPDYPIRKGHLRDFLMGFFSGLVLDTKIINSPVYINVDSIYFSNVSSFPEKIIKWKEMIKMIKIEFNVCFDLITNFDEQEIYISPLFEPQNINNYIQIFGFYYNTEIQNDLYIYSEFINSGEDSLFDFLRDVRIYKDNIIFSPIKNIRSIAIMTTVDFTTVNNNHNFVANGFITHNSAGIVKNMTICTQLTTRLNSVFIKMVLEELDDVLYSFDFQKMKALGNQHYYKIFLDGTWLGSTINKNIYHKILEYKQGKRFSDFISVSINHNEKEILLFSDEGRMIRPLFNCKNFPSIEEIKNKSFDRLIEENKILLVDSYEIENNIIAMYPQEMKMHDYYTLCEIHPSFLVGLCVGLIPYVDHTQAPRITYHASMGKQAIGLYGTTNDIRSDTIVHMLNYPEKPLIKTHLGSISGCNEMVFGMNLIVAVAMYTGFNQEDSVIVNQSAIDRGLFRSFSFRTIHIEERKKSTTHTEDILLPPKELRVKSFNYSKLDVFGIVKCGEYVGANDVLVGKVQTKIIKASGEEKMDASVVVKSGEEGYVDKIFISNSPEGYKIVKIKIRSLKIPEIGDKVASRAAQKGTIGMVLNQEDMPFVCDSGMIPDIIINPLCLPSRMTINQIIECIAAKVHAHKGEFCFGTPFTSYSINVVEDLCDSLVTNGFSENGKEIMCNGYTGEKFNAKIFFGPTYYHRLKHLVSAKIHARNHGSLQALTRQPVEGRSRDGGLRFGEMERDAIMIDTPISLLCGVSIKINHMQNKGWRVLGWDSIAKGMIGSLQTEFLDKGCRECLEITLEDGRCLYPSVRHPLLTFPKGWVRAHHLIVGMHLQVSLQYPLMDLDEELDACKRWSIYHDGIRCTNETVQDYLRTLSLVRILGVFIAGKSGFDHPTDRESFIADLHCVLQSRRISFPSILDHLKSLQPSSLPYWIMDKKCPTSIVREFCGSVLGALGETCRFRNSHFIITGIPIESHLLVMTIIDLLKQCNIRKTQIICLRKSISLMLHPSELTLFHATIGFRHHGQRSMRLEVCASFMKYRNVTKENILTFDQYLEKTGALEWFSKSALKERALPTMKMQIVNIRSIGRQRVFDLQVERTESFLANGVIAHNCMISHGVSRFLTERLFDMSDIFSVYLCSDCGVMPFTNEICHMCNSLKIVKILIPYACKLLFQELMAMGIKINLFPDRDTKKRLE